MGVALRLYEQLTDAGEDKQRAKVIADAIEQIEERMPDARDLATQGHVRESELRLQKEIKEVEGRLRKEIKEVEVRLVNTIHRQTVWVIGAVGAIVGLIRLLDHFLK